jgi:pimeloyl-ACP methyl ester carboxylesterase
VTVRPTVTVADRETVRPQLWGADVTYDGEFETSHAVVDGLRLEFTDWNPSAHDVVLLIHGLGAQGHTWDPIAHQLASRYRVVCPDLRGHGRSDWSRDGYRVADFCSDLVGLLDSIGVGRVDVVGHSLGGRVALAVAASDRLQVDHVLLSDMGPEAGRAKAPAARPGEGARPDVRGYRDEAAALEHFRELQPDWKPVFVRLHARYQVRRNWADKLVPCADPDLAWIRGSAGRLDDAYLWECCASLEVPVHLMWAAQEPYVDDSIVDRMHATISQFSDEKLDCGHYIPRQHPDYFCDRLSQFLGEGHDR